MRCPSTWRAALRGPRRRRAPTISTSPKTSPRRGRFAAWPRVRPRPSCRSAALRPASSAWPATHLSQGFDTLERLHMRVGALPQYPANALKYNLTWSVDGLINEYLHPCEAIVDGAQDGAAAARGLRDLRAGRRALRGLQHLRRPGDAGGDAGRQGPVPGLQDHPLPGPPRHRQAAAAGLRAGRQARRHEGHPADGDSHHRAGRRGRVRHRFRPAQRAAHPGVLRAQGLRADAGPAGR